MTNDKDRMRETFEAALDNLFVGIGDPKENARVVWEALQARDAEVAELRKVIAEAQDHMIDPFTGKVYKSCETAFRLLETCTTKHKQEG